MFLGRSEACSDVQMDDYYKKIRLMERIMDDDAMLTEVYSTDHSIYYMECAVGHGYPVNWVCRFFVYSIIILP